MIGGERIVIFAECGGILKLIGLYSRLKVPTVLIYILLSLPLNCSIECELIQVFEIRLHFQESAYAFFFITATFQIQLI